MKNKNLHDIKCFYQLLALVCLFSFAYVSLSAQAIPITFHLQDVLSSSTTGPWMFEHDDPGMPTDDMNCYTPSADVLVNGEWVPSENYAYYNFSSYENTLTSCIEENLDFLLDTDNFRVTFEGFSLTGFHKVNLVNPGAGWDTPGQAGDIREYTGGIGKIYHGPDLVLTVNNCMLDVVTPYPTAQQMRNMFWDLGHIVVNWQQEVGTGEAVTASGRGEIDVRNGFSDPAWVAAFANPNGNQIDFVMSTINYVIQGPIGHYNFDLGIKASEEMLNNAILPLPLPGFGNLNFGAMNLEMNFSAAVAGGANADLNAVSVSEVSAIPGGVIPPVIDHTLPHYWQFSTNLSQFTTDVVFDLTGYDLGAPQSWRIMRRAPMSNTWVVYENVTVLDNHTIKANAVSEFSDWTVGTTEPQTLPVELSSFTAIVNQSGLITLNWVSQSENEVAGYLVYRGLTEQFADALRMNNTLIPATNTSQQNNYSFTDEENNVNGTWYYWLEAQELNGSSELYGPITAVLNNSDGDDIPATDVTGIVQLMAFPNPFNPETNFSFYLPKATTAQIAIYNLKGQLVKRFISSDYQSGWHSLSWNGTNTNGTHAASGMYYVKLYTNEKTITKKIVLKK